MPRKIRGFHCEDCGKWTLRPRVSNEPWICVECGIDRRAANLPQVNRPVSFVADSNGDVISA